MKISEKQFLNTIRATALNAGFLFYHTLDSRGSDPGFPDVVITKNHHLWFIELKTENGKVSSAQKQWLDTLQHISPYVRAFVLRPKDFDKFWQEMRRI